MDLRQSILRARQLVLHCVRRFCFVAGVTHLLAMTIIGRKRIYFFRKFLIITPMKLLHTSLLIFVIVCSVILSPSFFGIGGSTQAQTTVCSGDAVVLLLNGYKQGEVSWKQSPDRTMWSQASGTAINDSLSFTATATYYYRATVTDGTCSPFYSDTTLVIVNPTPPIAKSAAVVTSSGFTANWSRVASAIDYFLDVAYDAAFTSFVPGKKNIVIGSADTTYSITANCFTTYYYRVRDSSGGCTTTSPNSNTITVTTDSCPVPVYCTLKSTCDGNITDSRDNKIYKTVQIGTQCWMAQNLNIGTMIMGIQSQTPGNDNQNTSIEKYCWGYGLSGDDSSKCATYGGLYLWEEMMAYDTSRINAPGRQGICPAGWHVPTDNEWKCLEMTLGMSQTDADNIGDRGTTEGGKLKDSSSLWRTPNTGVTNKSGFTALPGGDEVPNAGSFGGLGSLGYWWSATEFNPATAWYRYLTYNSAQTSRGSDYDKARYGLSARCVKN